MPTTRATARIAAWAPDNCFRVEDAAQMILQHRRARDVARASRRRWIRELADVPNLGNAEPATLSALRQEVLAEIADLQGRDLTYWSPILRDLRELRRAGLLEPESSRVTTA